MEINIDNICEQITDFLVDRVSTNKLNDTDVLELCAKIKDYIENMEEIIKEDSDKIKEELSLTIKNDNEATKTVWEIMDKIKDMGGRVTKMQDEGIKRLAYEIRGEQKARFYYCEVMLPKGKPAELSGWLNTQDNILRYLLVKTD